MKRRELLTFPWLSPLALRGAQIAAPKRLVCIGLDLSMRPEQFFPIGEGPGYELSPLLKPLARWQQQLTVFSHLDHPGVSGGHYGVHAFLSGVRREQGSGFADGCVSIDQLADEHLGKHTRYSSLCLGVGGGDNISWTRSGIAVPKLEDPSATFDLLFRPPAQGVTEARRARLAENQSAVALLHPEAKRLGPQLDRWDREKLDEFITALRDFERTTEASAAWLDKPLPETAGSRPVWSPTGCMDKVRATFDVMSLALQADATRIISFNIGTGLPVTKIPGVSRTYHDLSHSGQDPDKLQKLHLIESALIGELDRFLGTLAERKDIGGGTLLDHTTVVFGSGMGNASSHSNLDLPVLVAGGGLRHGRHLFFPKQGRKQTPLCNLYVSLLQKMGVESDRFGSSNGNLNEFLA